jgi:hypothetical protein
MPLPAWAKEPAPAVNEAEAWILRAFALDLSTERRSPGALIPSSAIRAFGDRFGLSSDSIESCFLPTVRAIDGAYLSDLEEEERKRIEASRPTETKIGKNRTRGYRKG